LLTLPRYTEDPTPFFINQEKTMPFRRRSLFTLAASAALIALAACAHANQFYVSPEGSDGNSGLTSLTAFKTIQKAINTAAANDSILVDGGIYQESLTWKNKDLTIQGAGANQSIIDPALILGGPGGRCLTTGGLTSASSITGFTFRHGLAKDTSDFGPGGRGGGIYNDGSNLTIANCIVYFNQCIYDGGGIFNLGVGHSNNTITPSFPVIVNCLILDNIARSGGGIYNAVSDAIITNCTFTGNSATDTANGGGGGIVDRFSNAVITNCILWGDTDRQFNAEIWIEKSGLTTVNHCDVQGVLLNNITQNGGFSTDPLFIDPDNGDYRLQPGSPCIDAADDTALPAAFTTDANGDPRLSRAHLDLGAFEYQNQAPTPSAGNNQTLSLLHDGDPATNSISVTLDGSASSDPEGDTFTYAWDDGQGHTANSAAPQFDLAAGTYTFTLTVTDSYGASASADVTIMVNAEPDAAPIAGAQNLQVDQDTDLNLTLSGSDPDAGDTLTYAVATSPAHGTLSGTAPDLTYTPNAGYTGADSFTFTVTDPYGKSSTATINITVNDTTAPVITLNGSDPMTIQQNSVFTDPGATAIDNHDGSVPVSVSGSVNTTVPGSYILTYAAVDAAGNKATKTRTVIVAATLLIEKISIQRAGNNALLKFIIRNAATTIATGVQLTGATLGCVNANQALPMALGSLSAGSSVSVTLVFKVNAGTQALSLSGSSSFGTFSLTQNVSVP